MIMEAIRLKQTPYWLDTSSPGGDFSATELPEQVDVAIVGGGLTGLSAAIHLAKKGASVALFEKEHLGWGASGRNGGMCTTGASVNFLVLIDKYGVETAKLLFSAYNDAIDLVEQLVTEEGIDCDFIRAGKLSLARKQEHYERYGRMHEALAKHLDHETDLVPPSRIKTEIGSNFYKGGLVDPKGAGLHVGKFVRGLGPVAARLGVGIHEGTEVLSIRKGPSRRHEVRTTRGIVAASQVLIATDGYTGGAVRRLQRRIIPVGSFIVATVPLDRKQVDELMPTRRMAADSGNLVYYFRITPDNRMLFGGRAQVALSTPKSNLKSARILTHGMNMVFPQLKDTPIEYAWGGHVGMTLDRLPHAGESDGIYYSLGYNGHGVQMATYMGRQMAEVMNGRPEANPWRDFPFKAVPLHFGPPWFLPFVDIYYRAKDKLR